jgi:DNA-binding beta-propeller fold protein YncE
MRTLYAASCSVFFLACFALAGCTSLKEGECKRASHCDDMVKERGELWACYKEPPTAEVGNCMRAKEAKDAADRYQRKLTGKCEDQDGDGVKAGDACDPPVDCDDQDPAIKPGAAEICDMKDNNCNDLINEGLARCVGTVLGGKVDPIVQYMITMPAGIQVAPNGELLVTDQHQVYRLDQNLVSNRFAGSNKPGREDKKGKFARFDEPGGIAVDAGGNVFVAECRNNCVRKVSPDGQVSVYAGKCSGEADDTGLDELGEWDAARFWCPFDLAFDADGGLLVADMRNSKIKRITKDRKVEHVAGLGGKEDAEGYVVFGYSNGPAKKAEFNEPASIAVGPDGAVYIADTKNNCIRRLKDGKVDDFAGVCVGGSDKGGLADGPAAKAKFKLPQGVEVDGQGAVWVADTGNHCVRMIQAGQVSTVAGKAGQQGYYDGPVDEALFNEPWSLTRAKDGALFVVDHGNYRIRRVMP